MKRHYTYKVTLPETGQFYIGVRSCNCDIKDDPYKGSMIRWRVDKTKLVKEIIKEYDTRDIANEAENFMIILQLKINKNPLCMNAYIHGIGFCMAGKKLSDATKLKMSLAKKDKKVSSKTRNKMSLVRKGKKHSNETKLKLSKPKSDETKLKMSESHKGMKNKKHSNETRQKMSIARKGMKYNKEIKNN